MRVTGSGTLSRSCCGWRGPMTRPYPRARATDRCRRRRPGVRRALPARCHGARGHPARRRGGCGALWIQANAGWIDRLMGVLVDNACKYAGTGGYVRLTVRGNSGRVFLQVDDTGPGIPMSQREVIFDRFHRAPTNPVVWVSASPSPTRWSGRPAAHGREAAAAVDPDGGARGGGPRAPVEWRCGDPADRESTGRRRSAGSFALLREHSGRLTHSGASGAEDSGVVSCNRQGGSSQWIHGVRRRPLPILD